ncbi:MULTISPECIES: hypothetical protein [unclassified Streptomyces]|uniref:hypothetical protein n=1 Tax=unclassified Streptomyces TaxID=2593676 RepID=UPI00365A7D8C
MSDAVQAKGPKLPPTYPPKSPPPPKRPVEAPRPQPTTKPTAVVERPRPRMTIRNRPTRALTFRSDQWAPAKAAAAAVKAAHEWGYSLINTGDLTTSVLILAEAAVVAGGRRLSLHLADQDQRLLALVLAHTPAHTDETTLHSIGALRSVAACGTDTDDADGLRLWALLETQPPKTTTRST